MPEEYEKPPIVYSYEDRLTFTMPANYVNWQLIDEVSDAEPSSKQYRRLMTELGITGRLNRRRPRRWRDDDWD